MAAPPSFWGFWPAALARLPQNARRAALASDAAAAPDHLDEIRAGYAFDGPALDFGAAVIDGTAHPDVPVRIPLASLNRHGLVAGATGTGKTYVACALAQQACRKGYRTIYRRASRLYQELSLAHADGSWARVLAKLARVDVLVLDDFALGPIREQERQDLLEVLEDRQGLRSTIVTSQVPVKEWHDYLGEPTVADAILERLVHSAHRLALKGPSRRKPKSTDQEKDS